MKINSVNSGSRTKIQSGFMSEIKSVNLRRWQFTL